MRYVLLIREDLQAVGPEEQSARAAAFDTFSEWMQAGGLLLGSERLSPAATRVQVWGGDVHVEQTDPVITARGAAGAGTGTGNREQVTGFCLVDCEDLDAAVRLATRVPAAWHGTVEVRPATRPQP